MMEDKASDQTVPIKLTTSNPISDSTEEPVNQTLPHPDSEKSLFQRGHHNNYRGNSRGYRGTHNYHTRGHNNSTRGHNHNHQSHETHHPHHATDPKDEEVADDEDDVGCQVVERLTKLENADTYILQGIDIDKYVEEINAVLAEERTSQNEKIEKRGSKLGWRDFDRVKAVFDKEKKWLYKLWNLAWRTARIVLMKKNMLNTSSPSYNIKHLRFENYSLYGISQEDFSKILSYYLDNSHRIFHPANERLIKQYLSKPGTLEYVFALKWVCHVHNRLKMKNPIPILGAKGTKLEFSLPQISLASAIESAVSILPNCNPSLRTLIWDCLAALIIKSDRDREHHYISTYSNNILVGLSSTLVEELSMNKNVLSCYKIIAFLIKICKGNSSLNTKMRIELLSSLIHPLILSQALKGGDHPAQTTPTRIFVQGLDIHPVFTNIHSGQTEAPCPSMAIQAWKRYLLQNVYAAIGVIGTDGGKRVNPAEDTGIYPCSLNYWIDDLLIAYYLEGRVGKNPKHDDLYKDTPVLILNTMVDVLPSLSSGCSDKIIINIFYPCIEMMEGGNKHQQGRRLITRLINDVDKDTREKAYTDIVNRLLKEMEGIIERLKSVKDLEGLKEQMESVKVKSVVVDRVNNDFGSSKKDGLKIVSVLVWLTHHLQNANNIYSIQTDPLPKFNSYLAQFSTLFPSSDNAARSCLSLLLSYYSLPPSLDPSIGVIPHPSSPLSIQATNLYPLHISDHILAIEQDRFGGVKIVQLDGGKIVNVEIGGIGSVPSKDNCSLKPVYLLIPSLSVSTLPLKHRHWVVDLSTMTALGYSSAERISIYIMGDERVPLSNKDILKDIVCKIIDRDPRYPYPNPATQSSWAWQTSPPPSPP